MHILFDRKESVEVQRFPFQKWRKITPLIPDITRPGRFFRGLYERYFAIFLKYGIVGGSCFLLDIGSLYIFVEFVGINYLLAATLALGIATCMNYYLNRIWTFGSRTPVIWSFSKYVALLGFNYVLMIATLFIFVEFFGINYLVVKSLFMSLIVLWNFLAYKFYVYK
jgi:putative flippase GtrA